MKYLFCGIYGLFIVVSQLACTDVKAVPVKTFEDIFWLPKATEKGERISLDIVPQGIIKTCADDYHAFPTSMDDRDIRLNSAWRLQDHTCLLVFEISNVFGPLVVYAVNPEKNLVVWRAAARID